MSFDVKGIQYQVKKIRQNEVNDIFEVTNLVTGESQYESFPRTMELSAEDVLAYYE